MWTPEREDKLKVLYSEGLSASQIARILGPDITRNGVLGKIHRWKKAGIPGPWMEGGRPYQPRQYAMRPRAPRALPAEPAAVVIKEPEPDAVTLADGSHVGLLALENGMCRWPYGDPTEPDFHFCGHARKEMTPVLSDCPYCGFHMRCAYQPRPRRSKAVSRGAIAVTKDAAAA
jgi:GcrA cell cycle regulator